MDYSVLPIAGFFIFTEYYRFKKQFIWLTLHYPGESTGRSVVLCHYIGVTTSNVIRLSKDLGGGGDSVAVSHMYLIKNIAYKSP